ncbi:unnamed protein product [Durusdinium trenchii]|uniref:Uncharacterized protein n=1 Tax=Durusdinium trenchii TaxID=1381693 RepID=A0ABP0R6W9_9DINO
MKVDMHLMKLYQNAAGMLPDKFQRGGQKAKTGSPDLQIIMMKEPDPEQDDCSEDDNAGKGGDDYYVDGERLDEDEELRCYEHWKRKVKSILDRINIRNFIGKDAVIKVEYLTSCRYWKKWFDDNLHVTFRGGLKSDDTGHHAFIFMRQWRIGDAQCQSLGCCPWQAEDLFWWEHEDSQAICGGQTNNLPKLENMEKEDRESLKDHFKERFEHSASEKARSNKNMNAVKKGNLKCMTKRPKYPKCTMLGGSSDYPCGFKSVKDAFNWPRVFLDRLCQKYGAPFVCARLGAWKWSFSSAFSGIGASSSGVVDLPVLCFLYRYPVDGMPTLHSWISVLRAILLNGFETWREVMEVKAVDDPIPLNQPLDYGKVLPVKGLGRMSMILWAIVHTYKHLADKISSGGPFTEDFLRWLRTIHYIKVKFMSASESECMWRRIQVNDPALNFKSAFLKAVDEFNGYGSAVFSSKSRIDSNTALQLYGFTVPRPELTSLFKEHAPVEEDHVRERLTIATQALEDKMDMKSLFSQSISLRCALPNPKKRVPLQFDAWVVLPLGITIMT